MTEVLLLSKGVKPPNYNQLQSKATLLAEAKRSFYQQHTKCAYLKDSDRCTKVFHDVVKRNSKRNAIVASVPRSRELTTSLAQVVEEFVSHFKELLGTTLLCSEQADQIVQVCPALTSEQQLDLARDITSEEIRTALLDIGNNPTLGIDGYGAKLFKAAWDTVGTNLLVAVAEFFTF